ncbi:TPA: hypothetical protein QC096_003239 [Bacillus thuringiensis]|nr:hypothetical protein [Bacillus thuringiensis]
MGQFKITFKIDSIINLENSFSIDKVNFFNKGNVLYAETIISGENVMLAQEIALEKIGKICSSISYIYRRPLMPNIISIEQIDMDGFSGHVMQSFEATLVVRKKVTLSDIQRVKEISEFTDENEDVKNVMALVNRSDFRTWSNLYKIFEIINKKKDIKKRGWMSEKKITSFKRTANHPAVSGLNARHGHQKEEPPTDVMKLEDAVDIICNVIEQWINYLMNGDAKLALNVCEKIK